MSGFFRRLFGGGQERENEISEPLLTSGELDVIGTEDDLLKDYETQAERNFQAMEAEQGGDIGTAIALYEQSVAEEFVGSHPYERLANIYELQGNPDEAVRVTEAFVMLARSGRLPKGSQRSAEKKLPAFQARLERLRGSSGP